MNTEDQGEVFRSWLREQMEARGWTQAELARQANVSNQAVSVVLSGKQRPGPLFCRGIAAALKMGELEVLERAGILEQSGDILPAVAGINKRLLSLTEAQRRAALRAIDAALRAVEDVARLSMG